MMNDNYILSLTDGICELYIAYRVILRDNPDATLLALFTHYQVELPENEIKCMYFIRKSLSIAGIDLILKNAYQLEFTRKDYLLLLPDIFERFSIPYSDYISCDDEDFGQVCDYSIDFDKPYEPPRSV